MFLQARWHVRKAFSRPNPRDERLSITTLTYPEIALLGQWYAAANWVVVKDDDYREPRRVLALRRAQRAETRVEGHLSCVAARVVVVFDGAAPDRYGVRVDRKGGTRSPTLSDGRRLLLGWRSRRHRGVADRLDSSIGCATQGVVKLTRRVEFGGVVEVVGRPRRESCHHEANGNEVNECQDQDCTALTVRRVTPAKALSPSSTHHLMDAGRSASRTTFVFAGD